MINIQDIIPFMCKGDYVSMQKNGDWYVYGSEPELKNDCWVAHSNTTCCISTLLTSLLLMTGLNL